LFGFLFPQEIKDREIIKIDINLSILL